MLSERRHEKLRKLAISHGKTGEDVESVPENEDPDMPFLLDTTEAGEVGTRQKKTTTAAVSFLKDC